MNNDGAAVPGITDKRILPPGILPPNIHRWAIGFLAIVMIGVIFFSGRSEPKMKTTASATPETTATLSSDDQLKVYRQRIDEESKRLAAEQAKLQQTKKMWATETQPTRVSPGWEGPGANTLEPESPSQPSQKSEIEQEREKRAYESHFASNIALSYRPDPKASKTDAAAQTTNGLPAVDPRLYPWPLLTAPNKTPEAASEEKESHESDGQRTSARPSDRSSKVSAVDLNHSHGKSFRLFEGTVLDAVLTNRLDGTFSGPVHCRVSYDLYSHDRTHLLIPAGTHVLGRVHPVESSGQQRLALTFDRLIMPDGYSASLDQFHGLDQVGETGLRDKVNHHYLQIFGTSVAIGMIAGLSQSNTQYSYSTSAIDAYRQGVANSLSQSSMHILDRFLNVLPTFTIREGQRIKIYLTEDLDLPAYENHDMPDDI